MKRRDLLRWLGATAATLPLLPAELRGFGRAAVAPVPTSREIEPYTIAFAPALLRDLQERLDRTRWPDVPFDTGWDAGTDIGVLRDLVAYWRDEYDWYAVQDDLNRLEHLRGPIDGEQLHCVHYPATGPAAGFPLLLIHGWPSSFHEFSQAAPRLAAGQGGGRAFQLIVPSLPGFAFSEAPRTAGVGADRIAQRLHRLMQELGFEQYGVQGGDWGAIIGTQMARRYPEAVVGLHVNFVASAPAPPEGTEPTAEEIEYRSRRERFQADETGYSSIQGSRPQSLAFAQTDSPVGWLAWMLEKYWAWGDHRGDLWSTFDRDALLTNAMLYWLPNRILSSARIYYETFRQSGSVGGRVGVPTAYAHFPAEPWGPPRAVVERSYNLVRYTPFDRGGHFPALEQPETWSADVAEFFGTF